MTRTPRPRGKALPPAALACLLATGTAQAQGLSLAREGTPAGDRGAAVQDAAVSGHLRVHAAATVELAAEPLVIVTPSQERDRVVAHDLWLTAGAALALYHRYLLAVDLPASLTRGGDEAPVDGTLERPAPGPELGDVRALARVRLLGPADEGVRLLLSGSLWAPSGAPGSYSSDERVRGGTSAIVGGNGARFDWSLEGGVRTRRELSLEGAVPLRVGTTALAGAALRYAVDAEQAVELGAELAAEGTVSNGAALFDPRSTRGLAFGTVRFRPAGSALVLSLALGPGLGHAPGAGEWRGVLRAAFSPPPDRDRDGIPDALDACVRLPGPESTDPNMNGCPEPPRDADADSIPDAFDACPRTPGVPTGARATHGCPAPKVDGDGDGIPDGEDACPDEPGAGREGRERRGCPAAAPAPPPPPDVALDEGRIVPPQPVRFAAGTLRLRAESEDALGQVARWLGEHPEVAAVEVRGYAGADDGVEPEAARSLAQDRAAAVVAWLLARGVDSRRLAAAAPEAPAREAPPAPDAVELRVVEPTGGAP
ncbi:MAG TPA: OmpA family protein [Polyangiaceae bacterium]|nr:OmpA family protein [Polyangiaceae bacterium]